MVQVLLEEDVLREDINFKVFVLPSQFGPKKRESAHGIGKTDSTIFQEDTYYGRVSRHSVPGKGPIQ